ncbi:uncharacterized protein BT62DRAFT_1076527 [Guyanagaster necrorhizus]|uniref:Uncharacterized protein n=1 Tax=Guyanagaster necrorhizus TaxID=856835 RepID=A0A9P7VT09_9AGAR|nr:uncharacterized protein BT62DRAFT_1076527 [Guyanagaster necrorhizus MCA 3950]KAG7446140.1 hypothetical protein BT62DRAFT_1076527 [Guyanagaster necrorhizus MCA 3950]
MNKRRRISLLPSKLASTSSESVKDIPAGSFVCIACNRTITTRTSCAILCSRCGSPTCVICSRKCTAHRPPLPSPSASLSPSRSALALNAPNTNLMIVTTTNLPTSPPAQSHKRKKTTDGDTEVPGKSVSSKDGDGEEEVTSCGRVVCRNCCIENVQSEITTCLDCFEFHSS